MQTAEIFFIISLESTCIQRIGNVYQILLKKKGFG